MAKDNQSLGEVHLQNVRLSFADIYKPAKDRKDPKTGEIIKGKYNCNFLLNKDDTDGKANFKKVQKAAAEVKEAKWGKNPPKLKPEKVCLRDGDLEDYDGYEGTYYVSASNNNKPVVVRRDRSEAVPGERGSPYSGCYVNAIVRLWAQDNEYGKRINASLEAVQYLKKGDAFGAKPIDPNEKFADLGDDEEEDDVADLRGDDDEDDEDDDLI